MESEQSRTRNRFMQNTQSDLKRDAQRFLDATFPIEHVSNKKALYPYIAKKQ